MALNTRNFGMVSLILLLAALYYWAQHQAFEQGRLSTVTTFSRSSNGLSVFQEVSPQFVSLKQSPILGEEELAGKGGIAIFSPLMELSASESKQIQAFVKSGGVLVLGFHDLESWQHLRSLLKWIETSVTTKKNPSYRNGEPAVAMLSDQGQPGGILVPHEKYVFYSSLIFDLPTCSDEKVKRGEAPAECFVWSTSFGNGKVILTAGLPFISNSMIWRENNGAAALRLLALTAPLLIDEYHHFFTDKSWSDLLTKWEISLPILILSLGLLILFVFGGVGDEELPPPGSAEAASPKAASYHRLHQSILSQMLRRPEAYPSAIAIHRTFLLRLYPKERDAIERVSKEATHVAYGRSVGRKSFLLAAEKLIQLHRDIKNRSRRSLK